LRIRDTFFTFIFTTVAYMFQSNADIKTNEKKCLQPAREFFFHKN
jgi:hypothetical protein